MDSKLPLYQWLVALVPGCAFVLAVYGLFHHFGKLPYVLTINSEAVALFGFLIIGLVVGEILQAISSIFEPLLVKTWGGRPSATLAKQSKYEAYFSVLKKHFGEKLSSEELFERAMALCNGRSLGRVEYFNVLYGYTRSFFAGSILLTLLTCYLMFDTKSVDGLAVGVVVSGVIATFLFWARAKRRGANFAKEVLVQSVISLETE